MLDMFIKLRMHCSVYLNISAAEQSNCTYIHVFIHMRIFTRISNRTMKNANLVALYDFYYAAHERIFLPTLVQKISTSRQ